MKSHNNSHLFRSQGRGVAAVLMAEQAKELRMNISILLLIPVLALNGLAWGDTVYCATDLGILGGYGSSVAAGINASGQVTGASKDAASGNSQGFLYSHGVLTALGFLPGGNSSAGLAINSLGHVVGESTDSSGKPQAFVYSGGVMMALPSPPNSAGSYGYGINDSGQITFTPYPSGLAEVYLYSGGVIQGLDNGDHQNNIGSEGLRINASGMIAGWVGNQSMSDQAYVFSSGGLQALGFLSGGHFSAAVDINVAGQVTGVSQDSLGNSEAFLYSGGVMAGLGFLPGGTFSEGLAINSSGQVVGYATDSTGHNRAFLYQRGTMFDLNSLVAPGQLPPGFVLSDGEGINDSGQIIANESGGHAYLLTPAQTSARLCRSRLP